MPNIGDVKTTTRNGKRYTSVYTSSGWKTSAGEPLPSTPANRPRGGASGDTNRRGPGRGARNIASAASGAVTAAARAVARAAKPGTTRKKTLTGADGTKTTVTERWDGKNWNQVSGSAQRQGGGSSSGGSSSGGSSSGSSSSKPAPKAAPKNPTPPKPGKTYRKTRALYKSEAENQPRSYETPEQRQARMDKSEFDMNMSAADVKAKRAKYLKTHPAAAKAVAKGTMSMGDINLIVRRLSKRGFDFEK